SMAMRKASRFRGRDARRRGWRSRPRHRGKKPRRRPSRHRRLSRQRRWRDFFVSASREEVPTPGFHRSTDGKIALRAESGTSSPGLFAPISIFKTRTLPYPYDTRTTNMGIGIGMRGIDLQKFLMVARERKVILLVRHTNEDSLRYVGMPGYYPKPALVKAKTADVNPPGPMRSVAGRMVKQDYVIAGLVVHPGMHPGAFKPTKRDKAMKAWHDGMQYLAAENKMPPMGDPQRPESWAAWGVG